MSACPCAQARVRLDHFNRLPLAHRERISAAPHDGQGGETGGGTAEMRAHTLRVLRAARSNASLLTFVATQQSSAHSVNNVTDETMDRVYNDACDDFNPQTPDELLLAATEHPVVRSRVRWAA